MAGTRLRTALRRVAMNDCGVAIIELAAVLPVLLLLLLGAIDISRMVASKLDLEQAAQRTTDFALSRRPTSSDGAYLQSEAIAASGLAAENVTIDIYLECNGVRQASFGGTCPAGQARARFASVVVMQTVNPIFDWAAFARVLGVRGVRSGITVRGDSMVRFQ